MVFIVHKYLTQAIAHWHMGLVGLLGLVGFHPEFDYFEMSDLNESKRSLISFFARRNALSFSDSGEEAGS